MCPAEDIDRVGMWLINIQMVGMLIGGIIWGVLGDKRGRLSVLFGSVLLYSVANVCQWHGGRRTCDRLVYGLAFSRGPGAGRENWARVSPWCLKCYPKKNVAWER